MYTLYHEVVRHVNYLVSPKSMTVESVVSRDAVEPEDAHTEHEEREDGVLDLSFHRSPPAHRRIQSIRTNYNIGKLAM